MKLRKSGKNTQKKCTEKLLMTELITMVWLAHLEPDIWSVKSIGLRKHYYEQS